MVENFSTIAYGAIVVFFHSLKLLLDGGDFSHYCLWGNSCFFSFCEAPARWWEIFLIIAYGEIVVFFHSLKRLRDGGRISLLLLMGK